MAVKLLPQDNTFTGTNADEYANSTEADETFTMGSGTDTINFDITNNKKVGTDTIYLTNGEDLTLNFYATSQYQIEYERVNNNDGSVDMKVKTYAYYTYGYYKVVLTASDEIEYMSGGTPYYKTFAKYYLYDYTNDTWVENKESLGNYYAQSNTDYHVEYYGRCRVGTDGLIEYTWNDGSDNHTSYASQNGTITGNLDSLHPNSIITIKNIGVENAANSIKLQYQYKSGDYVGSVQVITENLLSENYLIGKSYGIETEDQTLQGSFLNETFKAGYGNDTINTVGGTNTVNLYNGGKDVITLGTGADTVNGTFAQGQAQGHYEDLGTDTVANGGITIINGDSQDTLQLSSEGNNYFYKNNNDLVIIQNYQYNGGYTRLSKFTVQDYFANENRITIKDYYKTVSFNNSDTEVYFTNSDGYIYVASCNRYLDTDGEIYSRDYNYSTGNYSYTHLTQNSTIKYNRLGITLSDFSENKNTDGYYETGEINGKVYYAYYKTEQEYGYIYTKENTYTQLVENKSAKFANDLGIVWEEITSIGSALESNESNINGTNSSETIIATAQSNITTGNGDDIIYTTSANDTITIDGTGNKTVVIDTNSGNDTIIISDHTGNLLLDLPNAYSFNLYKNKEENAKDLIIERYSREYKDGAYVTETIGRTTIQGYFDFTAEQKAKIYVKCIENGNFKTITVGTLYIEGDEGEANAIYGTDYIDIITGKDDVDTIYTGKSADVITPNKGNDIININDYGTKTINLAQDDGDDTIILSENALQGSSDKINLKYTDGLTGMSKSVDNENNLVIHKTTVDGDNIVTESTTIKNETGNETDLNGKVAFYNEQGHYATLANNTPIYQELSKTEDNTYTADKTSNLVTGGSGVDKITATGEINHVYTGAGNDEIDVTSSRLTMIYSGSGADKITVNRGNPDHTLETVQIYAGEGDDEINVESGFADIFPGEGADTINIKGGTGGTLNFTAGEGNKTVNFIGAKDAKYDIKLNGYQSFTNSDYTTCKKEGNNFIIEIKYYDSKENDYKTETHTLVNFFDSKHCKIDSSDTIIYYSSNYTSLKYVELNVIGTFDNSQNATVFEGTDCEDIINGTDGVDIITTGFSSDYITAGKGDDITTLDDGGSKYFYYSKGDGDDTIIIADGMSYNDDFASGWSTINFYTKSGSESPDKYAYSIQNNDFTVYRIYNDNDNTITDSTTIKGIKGLEDPNKEVTYENIRNYSGGLNVSGGLYVGTGWSNVSQLTKGNDDSPNTITTNTDTKNTVLGGAKDDTITSQGSEDYIYAGAGDDAITTSATNSVIYAGAGNDEINVTAGTTNIYTGSGNDTIKISGGQGTINLVEGSGNNTLIFENNNNDGTCTLNGNYNIYMPGVNIYSYNVQYYYEKSGDDLIIFRNSGKQDTLKIKGLFGDNPLENGNNLTINGCNLSSMTVSGNFDKKENATIFEGSNYSDNIDGTTGKDIITTGSGNDTIYPGSGDDIIKITGSGTKTIYNYQNGGNDTVIIPESADIDYSLNFSGYSNARAYKIDGNDLILGRIYTNGDDITTETTRITGIKGTDNDNPAEVTYANISSSSGGLNISGKISNLSDYSKSLVQGKTNKANNLTTTADTNNIVTGGSKKDTVTLNGSTDYAFTGKGNDNITVNTNSSNIYSGSGNDKITVNKGSAYIYAGDGKDTITLNNSSSAEIYTGKGNDTINANGSGSCNIYSSKGGNDTVKIGKDFSGSIYASYNDSPTQTSHAIDKNGNLILYRTYINGNTVTNENTKITGINGKDENSKKIDVTYNNIYSYSGGLNVSGRTNISSYSKNMITGGSKLTSKKGANNIVVGGSKKETINLKGSTDYVYAGAGADNITVDTSNSAYIYSGAGNDKITINKGSGTIYLYAGNGNDTIVFNGTDFGNYNLYFSGYNTYNDYCQSGDDLLIKCTYKNNKNKPITETHTIKDYFKNIETLGTKLRIDGYNSANRLSDYGIIPTGKYDKKEKATVFEGSGYKDKVTGTNKKDLIKTGDGYDKITAGKGDDIVEIDGFNDGSGEYKEYKTIYINNGDGNDTIRWVDGAKGIANIEINANNVLSSEKSGTNLIITRTFESGKTLKTETITVEGYYDSEGNIVEEVANKLCINNIKFNPDNGYNRVDYNTNNINITTDYEFATGTKKADIITTTAEYSAIYADAGDDVINVNGGNTMVTGGYGNDTINIDTTGAVVINHSAGDGNDIVTFGEHTPSSLKINLESPMYNEHNDYIDNYMYMSGKHGIIKSGNDLIYSIPTSAAFNTKAETITFKDYFAEGVHKPEYISLSLAEDDYYYNKGSVESFRYNGIWADGQEENGVTTYTGLAEFNNRYEYKGTGKTVINGGDHADYYLVSINSKSNLYINDAGDTSGWGYDSMYLNTDYKNLRALFNVNSSGNLVVTNDNELSDNFMIFEKGSFKAANIKNILSGNDGTGVINIDHCFTTTDSYSPNGNGRIDYIFAGKNILKQCYNNSNFESYTYYGNKNVQQLYVSYWVEDLGQDVANWLCTYDGGKYSNSTSFDVFESNDTNAINSLLKVYNVAYDKTFTS